MANVADEHLGAIRFRREQSGGGIASIIIVYFQRLSKTDFIIAAVIDEDASSTDSDSNSDELAAYPVQRCIVPLPLEPDDDDLSLAASETSVPFNRLSDTNR